MKPPAKSSSRFYRIWEYHSLGFVVLGFVALWTVLYRYSNPNSHWGSFYGNAIADWLGAWVIIVVTKYLHEKGSPESRPFLDIAKTRWARFLADHSLSLFLLVCGTAASVCFFRMDPTSKWGAVVGNIVSQFVQLFGLVLLTKKLFEQGSHESKRPPKC